MAKVRARDVVSIYDHDNEVFVTLDANTYFDDTDPFVKANRWAFATDDELAELAALAPVVEVGLIEDASRAPGSARRTRRK